MLLAVDEVQHLSEEELSALITSVHRTTQKDLPVMLVGAGLPQVPGRAGDAKSYAERLFELPLIGSLDAGDARAAIMEHLDENFFIVRFDRLTPAKKRYLRAMAGSGRGPTDPETSQRSSASGLSRWRRAAAS